jgi:hypothetical protein
MRPTADPPARHAHHPLLAVYLRDHLTGATAGLELFERAARARRGTPAGAELARLVHEIGEDRETYKALMATLGVHVSLPKVALAWVGEKVTRLKSNGRLVRRSPLSDLVELEAIHLGVWGKEAGWHTLRIVAESDDRLDVARLDELIARARRQVATLERLRRDEARRLFAPTTGGGSPAPAAG